MAQVPLRNPAVERDRPQRESLVALPSRADRAPAQPDARRHAARVDADLSTPAPRLWLLARPEPPVSRAARPRPRPRPPRGASAAPAALRFRARAPACGG